MSAPRVVVACADADLKRRILEVFGRQGVEVVGVAPTGEHALLACATEKVSFAVLEEALPGMSGSSVAEVLRDMSRPIGTVVVHRGELPPESGGLDARSEEFDRALLEAVGVSPEAIRVFVVDDHETVRLGLQTLFEEEPDIVVVGSAPSGKLALEEVERLRPDVAVLDLRLPDIDGVELCREIRSTIPETRCLIFTAFSDREKLLKAVVAGASGYLSKFDPGEQMIRAIRAAAAGGTTLDMPTMESVLDATRATRARSGASLTTQQERVLDLIVEGLTNREIAERLELSEKTVKNYVAAILDKLQVRSRTQAAIYGDRRRRAGNGDGARPD